MSITINQPRNDKIKYKLNGVKQVLVYKKLLNVFFKLCSGCINQVTIIIYVQYNCQISLYISHINHLKNAY